ncbi:MAG: nitrate reductase molybdenum cofactor assembly chaperone [Lautropia sp.]
MRPLERVATRDEPRRQPSAMTVTLRALAHLLGYPDRTLMAHLPELRQALHDEAALGAARLAGIDKLIERLAGGRSRPDGSPIADTRAAQRAIDNEMAYVETFDRGRATSLHLFEHVHGDSRDRGPAMIDLVRTYEAAGLLLADGELPDYLPVVLQYASTQPQPEAVAFLGEIAHIVRAIFSALVRRESPYAAVLGALLDLAGERAEAVGVEADEDLDASWAEPAAFDGCSAHGQAAPGAVAPAPGYAATGQPIRIHRRRAPDHGIATRN